jgi:DNA-binding SARP family transcriptional activator
MSRGQRLRGAVRGITALVTLLALVVGLPILLYRLGGSPLPSHFPGWHRIGTALLSRDNGRIFLAAVRDVSWIAWAAFTAAVLAEAQAALRGRNAPKLPLGGLQTMAGRLVALTLLTFSAPATALLAAQPVPAAAMTVEPHVAATVTTSAASAVHTGAAGASAADGATVAHEDSGSARQADSAPAHAADLASAHAGDSARAADQVSGPATIRDPVGMQPASPAVDPPASQVMSMGFYQMVTVHSGDCLWTIAQHYLGDGDRYPEIVRLNLGHDMGGGHAFDDPSVIWPGWILQLPAAGAASPASSQSAGPHHHLAHPSREPRFRHPHAAATAGATPSASASPSPAASPSASASPSSAPAGSAASSASAGSTPGSAPAGVTGSPSAGTSAGSAPAGAASGSTTAPPAAGSGGISAPSGNPQATGAAAGQESQIPPLAVFAAGMLAGGAVVALSRMRRRQRQFRRPGRRIPLPASAPVVLAEQRLRASPATAPATALRAALSDLGAGILAQEQPIPDITGVRLLPSGMEILLASPAIEPPPPPFTVPGGHQGMAWHLSLPEYVPVAPFPLAETGDLLPGLVTAGAVDGGYLLIDLEQLRVTTVDGPPELADQVLATAAAELATSELAGWYDLILVGFPELEAVGSRATSCGNLEQALDLLAAKAVALRRRLGDLAAGEIRRQRLADPGDEDWALTLLVSRCLPTSGQLALLLDLTSDPAGIAALVPGGAAHDSGAAPASIQLSADPGEPGGMVARISPLELRVWPRPLDDADYLALGALFAIAAQETDVAADAPPYDGSSWPPWGMPGVANGLLGDDTDETERYQPDAFEPDGFEPDGYQLDGFQPGSYQPDGFEPDGYQLDGFQPGSYQPDGFEPDGYQPDGFQPGSYQPDGDQPEAYQPETYQAEAHQPDAYQAETHQPENYPPDASGPDPAHAAEPIPPAEPASLRIGVLGTLTVNGSPGALLPAQSQLILSLALAGQDGLSNQQLCYLLGADPDHPKPSDSLRQLIVRTRRQLGRAPDGREWIEHLGAGQYSLHPEARFDWHEFDALTKQGMHGRDAGRLREALRLIRGQPFSGCYHWSLDLALIETVRAQIVDAAEMLSGLELAVGDSAAAARAARTGLAGDTGAEQLWRALMRAEHAAGNMTGVREAWSRCLDAITDIAPDGEPHPETAALYRQLLKSSSTRPAWSPT